MRALAILILFTATHAPADPVSVATSTFQSYIAPSSTNATTEGNNVLTATTAPTTTTGAAAPVTAPNATATNTQLAAANAAAASAQAAQAAAAAKSAAAASTPSINPASQTGQGSQSGGSAMNMAAAAALMAACMASMPPNMALCAMGALAAMQGGSDSNAADQSAATNTASAISPGSNTASSGSSATTIAATGSGSGGYVSNPTIAADMNALKEGGYSVTPASVTSPDGTTTSAASFSPSSLSGSIGTGAVKDAEKVVAALNGEIAKASGGSMAVDGAGGGGSGGSTGAETAYTPLKLKLPGFKSPFALGADAQKKMLAGKTVLYEGEPIGTRGGNIFEMIHEAYQKRRSTNTFIEDGPDAVTVRRPAAALVTPAAAPRR